MHRCAIESSNDFVLTSCICVTCGAMDATSEACGVWLELPGAPPRACHRCGGLLESPNAAADALWREHSEGTRDEEATVDTLPSLPRLDESATGASSSSVVCGLGCGLPYCSAACADGDKGHPLLCVGPLTDGDVDHPLILFRSVLTLSSSSDALFDSPPRAHTTPPGTAHRS